MANKMQSKRRVDIKIVGLGLNKTGTGTLKACLEHWGYNHISYDLGAFNQFRNRDFAALTKTMDEYESFENWPWALMYQEFDRRYPSCKFILTVRNNCEIWLTSLCRHAKRFGPLSEFEQYIYGYSMPQENKNAHRQYYLKHNQRVEEYFKLRPDKFLKVCWDDGDDWQVLAAFLGHVAPDIPFPHKNKTPSSLEKIEERVRPALGRYKRLLLRNRF